MQKRKLVVILLIIVVSVLSISFIATKTNKKSEIIDMEQSVYNLKYSDAYTQYMNLSEEQKSKLGVIPRMYDVSLDTLTSNEDSNLKTIVKTSTPPSTYSLEDDLDIKVEQQGNYGTCWTFASLNALETNLALQTGVTYDFSESHIDHLMTPTFGNDERELHQGGMFYIFMEYIMSDYGPVLESDVPYETSTNQYDSTDYEEWETLKPIVNLVEVVDMPTINKKTTTYTDTQLTTFRNAVKTHIMQNGSLYAAVLSTDIKTYNGKKVLNSNTSAELPDHAITIIGWDDEFAITNFPTASRPTNPGAYIALNSWGSSWGENGIFYISYEDVFVEQEMSGVVSTSTTFNYVDVQIEDEAFYTALKEELNGKCISSVDTTKTIKIKTFTQTYYQNLVLENKGINSIEGIQGLTGIYYLDVAQNNLSNVSPILELPNLGMLQISYNEIRDLTDIFNSSLSGLSAISQNIIDESLGASSNQITIPPLFYQAFYINGGSGVSVVAKIYYDCDTTETLDDNNAIEYTNFTVNSSTGTANITLDREISTEKPEGTRAIKLTLTDSGFVNGSTYTFYYNVMKGDANNDEIIDSMDAYLTLKLIVSGNSITEQQLAILDLNGDGNLNSEDVTLVLQKAVE